MLRAVRANCGAQLPDSRVSASFSTRPPAETPACASSPTSSASEAARSVPLGGCTGRPGSISSSDAKPWRGTGGDPAGFGGPPLARLGGVFAAALADRLAFVSGVVSAELEALPSGAGAVAGREAVAPRAGVPGAAASPGAALGAVATRAATFGVAAFGAVAFGAVASRAAVFRAVARRALGRWGRVLGRLESTPRSLPEGTISESSACARARARRLALRGSSALGGLMRAQSSRT